jgi:hypothetical protein
LHLREEFTSQGSSSIAELCCKLVNGLNTSIIMKANARENQTQSPDSGSNSTQEFNFELWANQVRPLLLASLSKRGSRY